MTNQKSKTRYPEGGPCGSNSVQAFSQLPTTQPSAMRPWAVAALCAAVGWADCVFNMSAIQQLMEFSKTSQQHLYTAISAKSISRFAKPTRASKPRIQEDRGGTMKEFVCGSVRVNIDRICGGSSTFSKKAPQSRARPRADRGGCGPCGVDERAFSKRPRGAPLITIAGTCLPQAGRQGLKSVVVGRYTGM